MMPETDPTVAMFRAAGPNDHRSFLRDEDGEILAGLLEMWKTLYYLPYFHPMDSHFDCAMKEVFWTPFEQVKHVVECHVYGATMRLYAFEVGRDAALIGYQYLSTGDLKFDLRLTAADQDTAYRNLRQIHLGRMRHIIGPFPLIPYAKAEPMIFGGNPARIAKTAPEIVLLTKLPKKTRLVWWRRIIRDPYMATIWELKSGEVQIQFTGARHPLFAVPSREAGLDWIRNAFEWLQEK